MRNSFSSSSREVSGVGYQSTDNFCALQSISIQTLAKILFSLLIGWRFEITF